MPIHAHPTIEEAELPRLDTVKTAITSIILLRKQGISVKNHYLCI